MSRTPLSTPLTVSTSPRQTGSTQATTNCGRMPCRLTNSITTGAYGLCCGPSTSILSIHRISDSHSGMGLRRPRLQSGTRGLISSMILRPLLGHLDPRNGLVLLAMVLRPLNHSNLKHQSPSRLIPPLPSRPVSPLPSRPTLPLPSRHRVPRSTIVLSIGSLRSTGKLVLPTPLNKPSQVVHLLRLTHSPLIKQTSQLVHLLPPTFLPHGLWGMVLPMLRKGRVLVLSFLWLEMPIDPGRIAYTRAIYHAK